MAESVMLKKAKDFAVEIVELCKTIKNEKRETMLISSINTAKKNSNQ